MIYSDDERDTVKESAIRLLAEVLGLDQGDIEDDASMTTTPGWDSFAHTELCERVGEFLSVDLSNELTDACSSLESLVAFFHETLPSKPSSWAETD